MHTHYKPTETFQYTNYNSCHPASVKKGFVKGEALRLLIKNSSKVVFEENIENFKTRLVSRGYPSNLVDKILSEVNFADRKNALTQKQKVHKKILPFVTQFQPSLPCLKNILMDKWHLIQNQPLLREIYKEPPLISYRKGKSLKDMLVKQNYKGFYQHNGHTAGVVQVCQSHLNRLKMNKLIGRTSHRLCTFPTSIREIREIKYYFNI